MSDLYKAAQQALEALRLANAALGHPDNNAVMERAITALRAALAQQAEPVAPSGWAYRYPDGIRFNDGCAVNGCGPIEAIPYWFGAPPAQQANVKRLRAQQVVCLRCGHENWIMKGKAPAQITEADKAAAQQAEPVACNEQITVEELAAALGWPGGISSPVQDKVELLRIVAHARVAQQAEPVAIHQFRELHSAVWHDGYADHSDGGGPYEERVLYTAPPRREWAPLTDEQISDAWNEEMVFRRGYTYEDFKSAARRLDDALKERNK